VYFLIIDPDPFELIINRMILAAVLLKGVINVPMATLQVKPLNKVTLMKPVE